MGGGWSGFQIKRYNTGLAGGGSRWRLSIGDKLEQGNDRNVYSIKLSLGPGHYLGVLSWPRYFGRAVYGNTLA